MKTLIMLLVLGAMGSCRAVLKTKSSADSSAVRSQTSNDKFTREIIREYLPGRSDTIFQHSISTVEVPRIITVPGATLYRETIREAGESQKTSAEEKTVSVEDKKVEKEPLPWWVFTAIGMGGLLLLLLIGAVIYVVIKIRGIPASIINKTIT